MLRSSGPNPAAFAYQDKSATPGNVTIDRRAGLFAFPVGSDTVVVSNSSVTPTSLVIVSLRTQDTGPLATSLRMVTAVPGNGLFTATGNNTANTVVVCSFLVLQGVP